MEAAAAQTKSHNSMAKVISRILNQKVEAPTSLQGGDDTQTRVVKLRKRKRSRDPENRAGQTSDKTVDVVEQCHLLPRDSALEKERGLQKISTQAVVQLFNAVSKHQKEVETKVKEAGKSEHKKAKVLSSTDKKDFIDHLRISAKSVPDAISQEPSWSVLRDDFTKGSSIKPRTNLN